MTQLVREALPALAAFDDGTTVERAYGERTFTITENGRTYDVTVSERR